MKRKPKNTTTPRKPTSNPIPKSKPEISRKIESNRKRIGKVKSNFSKTKDLRIQSQINRLSREIIQLSEIRNLSYRIVSMEIVDNIE